MSLGQNFTVGVVGVGCVGGAVLKYYQQRPDVQVVGYDKYKDEYSSNFDALLNKQFLFLCLPTLYNDEIEQYDKDAIHNICGRLNESRYTGLVVLKSTVEPGTAEKLSVLYDCLDIAHNPEFLTARTAYEDFATQSHVVLGTTRKCNPNKFANLETFMRLCWPNATYNLCSSTESESMKSFCNCFYAQKISIFNEYYVACKAMGIDYHRVLDMMLTNGWINKMHTDVPGPDGKMGYGGMCFPKDTSALYQHLKREKLPHKMIEASVTENKELRDRTF
jgi:UDPglucose 6-dehydrogenase